MNVNDTVALFAAIETEKKRDMLQLCKKICDMIGGTLMEVG